MPVVSAVVECPVRNSFRVQQVAGLFDMPLGRKARAEFRVQVPGVEEDWRIGAIVGPSGSGKTTIVRQAFGDAVWNTPDWPRDKAVVDCFGDDLSIKTVTLALTAVGFSSPPAWVKPYWALSNGEKFRCDLARALLGDRDLVVFDEFTSVVDRTAAKVGSAAVAKALRGSKLDGRAGRADCKRLVAGFPSRDRVAGDAASVRGRFRGGLDGQHVAR